MDIKKAIRALLQSDFGGVQLSDARVEQLAKRLEGKVETEDQLKEKLSLLNELEPFSEKVKEDDRLRSFQSEIEKLKKGSGKSEEKDKGDEGAGGSGRASEGAEAVKEGGNNELLALLKEMKNEISSIKSEKVVTDRRSTIISKLEGADKSYSDSVLGNFEFMTFPDDETFNKYLAKVETDFANHTQTQAESKLGKDSPFSSVGKDGKVKEATKEELDSVMSEIGLQ